MGTSLAMTGGVAVAATAKQIPLAIPTRCAKMMEWKDFSIKLSAATV